MFRSLTQQVTLAKVILAARLLGAPVALVSVIGDLSNVTAQSSLQSGIAYAITRQ